MLIILLRICELQIDLTLLCIEFSSYPISHELKGIYSTSNEIFVESFLKRIKVDISFPIGDDFSIFLLPPAMSPMRLLFCKKPASRRISMSISCDVSHDRFSCVHRCLWNIKFFLIHNVFFIVSLLNRQLELRLEVNFGNVSWIASKSIQI